MILAGFILMKHAHKLALRIAKELNLSTLECAFDFINLRERGDKLLAMLEYRLAQKEHTLKQEQEARKKRGEEARQERVRQSILNVAIQGDVSDKIAKKRVARDTSEVMLIEDDAMSRRLIGNLLNKQHHITALADAGQALHTYVRTAPDILFLDINLPDVTGHELLERILKLDPQAYVVMLSGNTDRENVMKAMRLGAKGFVAKPFTPDKLHHYIQNCPTIH